MSEDVYMWAIGGFLTLMGMFTKVAYSEPNFYMGFLEKIISKLSFYLLIILGSFWLGLYLSQYYAQKNLKLSPEQLKIYLTDYNQVITPLSMIYFACSISHAYSFFLVFVAKNKKIFTTR